MSTSAEQVLSDDNLLSEILIRLPEKPLFRFKSVSKHWLGLITSNPLFSHYNNPDPYLVSGLFHPCFETNSPIVELIPLRHHNNNQLLDGDVSKSISSLSITDLSAFTILSSSRGLLLCCGYNKRDSCFGCFILNPTTKQFTLLPELEHDEFQVEGLSLAFDPYLSPHYKVVVLWAQPIQQNDAYYNIEIYSSETCSWRPSGETITISPNFFHFQPGNCAYCNGAIHWIADGDESYYFNIEQDFLGILPMPPLPEGKKYYDREIRKFFESRNHLHVVDIYGPEFNVFELEIDYSGWFVKYCVDLNAIPASFPEMRQIVGERSFYETYKILSIVREEKDDESFMVIDVRGRFLRYGLITEAFQIIYDEGVVDNVTPYLWWDVHHYIKSYTSVGNSKSGQARKRPLTLQREGRRGGRGRGRGRPWQRNRRGRLART